MQAHQSIDPHPHAARRPRTSRPTVDDLKALARSEPEILNDTSDLGPPSPSLNSLPRQPYGPAVDLDQIGLETAGPRPSAKAGPLPKIKTRPLPPIGPSRRTFRRPQTASRQPHYFGHKRPGRSWHHKIRTQLLASVTIAAMVGIGGLTWNYVDPVLEPFKLLLRGHAHAKSGVKYSDNAGFVELPQSKQNIRKIEALPDAVHSADTSSMTPANEKDGVRYPAGANPTPETVGNP